MKLLVLALAACASPVRAEERSLMEMIVSVASDWWKLSVAYISDFPAGGSLKHGEVDPMNVPSHQDEQHVLMQINGCKKSCGDDKDCYEKCLKPSLEPLGLDHKCEEFKVIGDCHLKCMFDHACHAKCPLPRCPRAAAKVQASIDCHGKCPAGDHRCHHQCPHPVKEGLEKCKMSHNCHMACPHGDHECHHKCPQMWGIDGEHQDHRNDHVYDREHYHDHMDGFEHHHHHHHHDHGYHFNGHDDEPHHRHHHHDHRDHDDNNHEDHHERFGNHHHKQHGDNDDDDDDDNHHQHRHEPFEGHKHHQHDHHGDRDDIDNLHEWSGRIPFLFTCQAKCVGVPAGDSDACFKTCMQTIGGADFLV